MKVTIEPGNISGILAGPSSKSMTQRAYAAALLHHGVTIISRAGHSEDEQAALQIIQQLGAEIVMQEEGLTEISSNGIRPVSDSISCFESGLSARLFTPIASLSGRTINVTGGGSLLRRPMDGFQDVLPLLNVAVKEGLGGYMPFSVQGPMIARSLTLDASGGSQFLSGLLFALCECVSQPVVIKVNALKSKPYIDLTLDVLGRFGKIVTHNNYREFFIDPSLFVEKEIVEIEIEADWSSAAFFLVGAAIAGDITLRNLSMNSKQADKAIVEVLQQAGADMHFSDDSITVKRSPLQAFEFDATDCPDLFPALAILAACCDGNSYIEGVHRLFYKESNRVESITQMLQDFAVPFSVEEDTLCITGVDNLQGTIIDSYHDHRIVMAAAIGALRANGPVEITFAESINKSYPGFFEDLILCDGQCTFNETDK
jgi:3-phosphoshikimate 1-carboxyvinyltransferase